MATYLRQCLSYFFSAGFFSLFANTLYLTFPLYMMAIYDRVLSSASFSTLFVITGGALLALVTLGILELLRSRILVRLGVKLDSLIGRKVLDRMLKNASRPGTPTYQLGLMDMNVIRHYFAGNAIFAFFDVPWIPIYLGVIYLMHPILGYTAAGGAFVIFILGVIQHFLSHSDLEKSRLLGALEREWLGKCFRNAELLKAMGMVSNTARYWNRINDMEMDIQEKSGKKGQFVTALSMSFRVFMQVAIYCVGALLFIKNQVNMGSIIAASIVMGRALAPVQQGIGAWQQTATARLSYRRLDRLLKESQEIEERRMMDKFNGRLDVDAVTLKIADESIIENLSFSLEPGESLGLVGHNGAGKTSLCRMLLGTWNPTHGKILLDGQAVDTIDSESLGPFIGYLPQDVELFTGTVSENIARMGPIDSSAVIQASKMADAHREILRFSHGYETDIGEAGLSLSGGQRQRVGLARALYGTPSLVILDEPNSNLDDAGEMALLNALKRLKDQGTTVIMITHKMSLLSGVDKVLTLQKGSPPEFGSRDDFFKKALAD
ncbi:ATP-binding cassette, subfamily C, EexD [Desulfocicer vacuolatum DSM 3385]|uniref:ATP-binding cassette, subfamily C, EexD n=1 Tax=Desulfocicer vacuolatum DSM 3385 TaxID=1121400 RepID=A0A1W2BUY3_9BACT|nr:type I secretion system permease/ATPase [Desulfocicer vacuolatum]SMC76412.1 ATP-binding cassette, subfamily C, EexD [Desulfocicer vacuolatum DSM 3385]